jgi:hypothetical protein
MSMHFVNFSKHQSKASVALHPNCTKNALEPATGIEPVTCCLQNSCSAVELRRRPLKGKGWPETSTGVPWRSWVQKSRFLPTDSMWRQWGPWSFLLFVAARE